MPTKKINNTSELIEFMDFNVLRNSDQLVLYLLKCKGISHVETDNDNDRNDIITVTFDNGRHTELMRSKLDRQTGAGFYVSKDF